MITNILFPNGYGKGYLRKGVPVIIQPLLPTANLAIRKAVLDEVGLFLYSAQNKRKESGFVYADGENAYPIYALGYQDDAQILKDYLGGFANLQTMGRAGLFCYDNSDHALLTGMFAADNFLNGHRRDLWSLHVDEGYLES